MGFALAMAKLSSQVRSSYYSPVLHSKTKLLKICNNFGYIHCKFALKIVIKHQCLEFGKRKETAEGLLMINILSLDH